MAVITLEISEASLGSQINEGSQANNITSLGSAKAGIHREQKCEATVHEAESKWTNPEQAMRSVSDAWTQTHGMFR